jgi:ABC-type transporter Mla MlaB component
VFRRGDVRGSGSSTEVTVTIPHDPGRVSPSGVITQEDGANLTVIFHGVLDRDAVGECAACLARPLGGNETIVFDLADVVSADADGVDYLAHTWSDAERAGKRVRLSALSLPVSTLCETAGLWQWFDALEDRSLGCPFCSHEVAVGLHECPCCGHDFMRE